MTLAAEDWGPWSTTPSQRLQSLARIRARRNGQPVDGAFQNELQ